VVLVGSLGSAILSFLLVLILTRMLGPLRSGLFFESVGLFTILSNTAELGADTGLVRSVSRDVALRRADRIRPTIRVALGPVILITVVLAVVVIVVAPRLAALFISPGHRDEGILLIRVLAPFLPAGAGLTVALAGTRGFGTMIPHVAVQQLAVPGIRVILVAIAAATGLGIGAVGVAWAVPLLGGFVAAIAWLLTLLGSAERGVEPIRPDARRAERLGREFWAFSAPRGLASFFQISVIWLDVLLVGGILSTREAGIYAAMSRFAIIGTVMLGATSTAFAPQVAGFLARNDRPRAQELYRTVTAWMVLLGWPPYFILAVFSPFLATVFGRRFGSGRTALLILALGMLSLVGSGNNKIVLLMGGRSRWNVFSAGLALLVNVVMNVLLIPRLGIDGAAVAWAASLLVDNVVVTILVWRLVGLHPFGRSYAVAVASTGFAFGLLPLLIRWQLGPSIVSLSLGIGVGLGIGGVIAWRARGLLHLDAIRHSLSRSPSG
jgi:O-antigen/teichoic acid export membrane protein